MQLVKTFLQEKFNKVVTPGVNRLIRFTNNGELESVDATNAGLRPQIYLLNNTAHEFDTTPTCVYQNGTVVQPTMNIDRAYYFDVPGPSTSTPTRVYTINYIISGTNYQKTVNVTEYKQYSVIVE